MSNQNSNDVEISDDEQARKKLLASQALAGMIASRSGKPDVYGESRLVIEWRAGKMHIIKIEESATYK